MIITSTSRAECAPTLCGHKALLNAASCSVLNHFWLTVTAGSQCIFSCAFLDPNLLHCIMKENQELVQQLWPAAAETLSATAAWGWHQGSTIYFKTKLQFETISKSQRLQFRIYAVQHFWLCFNCLGDDFANSYHPSCGNASSRLLNLLHAEYWALKLQINC